MERREFLKLTLGFTAAAGAIAATAATVHAAPMLPAGDTALPPGPPKTSETTMRPEEAKTASQDEINAIDATDTDMSARRRWWRRRRRVYWRPRRRRLFRRRRRVIYY
jgi:hypothetical protein